MVSSLENYLQMVLFAHGRFLAFPPRNFTFFFTLWLLRNTGVGLGLTARLDES
jgi:hypothetical protein